MYLKKIIIALSIISTFIACNTSSNQVIDDTTIDSTLINTIDTIQIIEPTIDTISKLADSLVKDGYVDETVQLEKVIEEKYGKQWDFCDCVIKNDSINKAMSNLDGVSDEDVDKLFLRWDKIESHCMKLLTAPNKTPDERNRHARKVRKCLKNAGIK